MEQRINIAELLKDCPQGMELDCVMFENLEFDRIEKDDGSGKYYIICRVKTKIGYNVHTFTEHGCYSSNNYAKCVIFPKGKTTWEGFQRPFKDGDIIHSPSHNLIWLYKDSEHYYACVNMNHVTENVAIDGLICIPHDACLATKGKQAILFKKMREAGYKWNSETKTLEELPKFKDGDIVATTTGRWIGITSGGVSGNFIPTYCVIDYDDKFEAYFDIKRQWCFSRLATEEEKQKLFQTLNKNGYKWNAETKTMKKITAKFKVGDEVKSIFNNCHYIITDLTDTHYTLVEVIDRFTYTEPISEDKNWELVLELVPKFKVGDRIKWIKTGKIYKITKILSNSYITNYFGSDITILFNRQDEYELVQDKFDINTLVPFESKVLVRDSQSTKWLPAIWGFYNEDNSSYPYEIIGGNIYKCCIPYEGNEHLLATMNDCDDYYKNWV